VEDRPIAARDLDQSAFGLRRVVTAMKNLRIDHAFRGSNGYCLKVVVFVNHLPSGITLRFASSYDYVHI